MSALLSPGTRVRVRDDWPETRGPCHIRTPHYLRGAEGVVEKHLGAFPNPEDLAFARPAATLNLYHVRFVPTAIWPDAVGEALVVELYETWLEAAR
jgi:nitrile hydratase